MAKHGDVIITGGDRTEDRSVQREATAGKVRRVREGLYHSLKSGRPVEEVIFESMGAYP